MSFDAISRGLFEIFQLSRTVLDTCRQVCGEQEILTREVASLHAVVSQLQDEAERPNSSLRWQDDVSRKELRATIKDSRKVLKVLDQVLEQYAFSLRKGGARKGLFRSIKFGNGEVQYMSDLLEELSVHKAALSLNLRLLTPSSRGSVEWPLGRKYARMQQSIHRMVAEISSSHDGSSQSSSYSDDEETVWREIRRGLERKGWSSHVVKKHRKALKEYVKSLGWSDTFDEIPPPAHPSLQRQPQEDIQRGVYSPESSNQPPFPPEFPQQNIQPGFAPQNLPLRPFPPQNFQQPHHSPPQGFPPQPFQQHEFPSHNFSQQSIPLHAFPQPIVAQLPQRNFSRQLFPQPSFSRQIFSYDSPPVQAFPPPNPPPENFSHESLPRTIDPEENNSHEHGPPDAQRFIQTPPPPLPPPHYVQPSVSDENYHVDGSPEFITLPPRPESEIENNPDFVTLPPREHQVDDNADFVTISSRSEPGFGENAGFIALPPHPQPQFGENPEFITHPAHAHLQPPFNEHPAFVTLPMQPPKFDESPAFVSLPRQSPSHFDEKAEFITLPPQREPQFEEKPEFVTLPPRLSPQFSVRPGDLADTFQCSAKDTWNDMLESLVTTLIDTTKSIYFPCSICKKLITTAPALLDCSQNWCRNCFHAIVYNILYYPLSLPSSLNTLRPIPKRRMQDIMTPTFRSRWVNAYERLRAQKGRLGGRMLEPSMEDPPLLLFRHPVVKEKGRVVRKGYFEMQFFEEGFNAFAERRKQKA